MQLATQLSMASTHTPEFSRLFEEHHALVFRTAYRITGNAADAEDVLQTIFLRMLRRAASMPAVEKQESYFRRAAVNASLDLLRSRHSERSARLSDIAEPAQPSNLELRESLRRALVTLSPRSAEVFALRYLEDFTNQQIAQTLNLSQVLVAVTLHRARRQLQKEIRSNFGGRI